MKNIFIPAVAVLLFTATACEWTEPASLDYYRKTVEELDPDGYEAYLKGVRQYKKTDHKVMILTIDGTSEYPVKQQQRLMSLPDSVDYICIDNAANLHHEVVKEIEEVKKTKGTSVLAHVDFSIAEAEWLDLKNDNVDAGLPEPTEEECIAFFKQHAENQLDAYGNYGFDGVMMSYTSSNTDSEGLVGRDAFVKAVETWKISHIDALLFVRGNVVLLSGYKQLLSMSEYIMLVLGGQSGIAGYEAVLNANFRDVKYKDRTILEVTVPNKEQPEQIGDSPYSAAVNILSRYIEELEDYRILGIAVSDAGDDYYNETYYAEQDENKENPIWFGNYVNIRRAINVFSSRSK